MSNTASLLFDGVNDVADSASSPTELSITGDKTIEFWAKVGAYNVDRFVQVGWASDTSGNYPYAVMFYFNFLYFVESVAYGEQTHQSSSIAGLSTSTWHHFAITVSSRVVQAYVDGATQGGTTTLTGSASGTTSAFRLGQSIFKNYYSGRMDEVRVWNVARSAAQIAAYKDIQAAGSETGLVGCFRMNEGSGTSVADLAGTANDLTISGATWDTSDFPTLTDAGGGGATTTPRLLLLGVG